MNKRKRIRKTFFSKNVIWLKPFFYATKDLIPLDKVTSIRGYSVPLSKQTHAYAWINKVGQKYRISLNLFENDYLLGVKDPKMIALILEDLAHELSHVVHFEECSAHFKLMGKIITRFGDVLETLGLEQTDIKHTDLESENNEE